MSVQTGQEAPDFDLYDTEAEPVRLSDYRGQHVLLLFFPGAFSHVCASELSLINEDVDDLRAAGVQVFGISTDSTVVLDEFKDVLKLDFPLLSDHNAEAAARFGAKYNHDFTHMKLDRIAKRAAFVIDRDGVVRYAEVLEDDTELPDFDAILHVIDSLD